MPAARIRRPASKAPGSVLTFRVAWNWEELDPRAFSRPVRNFGAWCEGNSDADSPQARLFSILFLHRRQYGKLELKGLSTAGGDAERLFDEHLAAVNEGVGVPCAREVQATSWLGFALDPFPELFGPVAGGVLFKGKDAFFRRRLTEGQVAAAHDYLTRTDHDVPGGMLGLATYGGRVNSVAPDATASAQRSSVLSTSCAVGWGEPGDEARSPAWVRQFYRALFADSGGAVPRRRLHGAMINHPDVDLADPEWNTSALRGTRCTQGRLRPAATRQGALGPSQRVSARSLGPPSRSLISGGGRA